MFSISEASIAQAAGMPLIGVVLMGAITGVFGGVLRDVARDQIPVVFRNRHPYALCAVFGCLVYWLLHGVGVESWLKLSVGVATTTGLRLLALAWGWRIPAWPSKFKI